MDEARSMAEAAALLEIKLPALHRRVRQMVKLGLLEVSREETRTGHRIKFYRTTSHEFIVPLEATPSTDLETFIGDGFSGSATILSRGVAKALEADAPRWGVRVFWQDGVFQELAAFSENGALLEPTTQKSLNRAVYGDCGLRLTRDDAQAFGAELQTLYERYLTLGQLDGDPYFLFVGFTPV